MKHIGTKLLAALLCLCLLAGCAAAPQGADSAAAGTSPPDTASPDAAFSDAAAAKDPTVQEDPTTQEDPTQDTAHADAAAQEDTALRAALRCLVYLGEYIPAADSTRVGDGLFYYHQQLTEAERAALTALLRPEEWQPLTEIPAIDWFTAPVCAKSSTSARLLLRDDLALYLTDAAQLAWALPEGVSADAEAFYAGLEAQGRDSFFPLAVTDFTEVGYDLEGPGSFDVRFPLTGELQQRFIDAIHPETWQRYELFFAVGWTSSGLHAAAGDAGLTVYGMYDDGQATAVLHTPDGLHLYTVPAEECAALRQLYADINALPVD